MKVNVNTPLKFLKEQSTYVPGDGYTTEWAEITSSINLTGAPQDVSVFWVEWQSAFGNQVLEAQAVGVNEMATIRMAYNPTLYEALRLGNVIVAKDADDVIKANKPDKDNPNAYELFGGVDNYKELDKVMEFKVRRYEVK